MSTDEEKIEKLTAFVQREKFSADCWNQRGLNPSSEELCMNLSSFFNQTAEKLIDKINQQHSARKMRAFLNAELFSLEKSGLDTEEKEFICDLFQELSTIVGVDFHRSLERWLYGYLLTSVLDLFRFFRMEKQPETISQSCTNCGTQLETHILRRKKDIPESSWMVGKCNRCAELNLLSYGPGVKELRCCNYQWVDSLQMDEYNYEEALLRVEQIKYFRK